MYISVDAVGTDKKKKKSDQALDFILQRCNHRGMNRKWIMDIDKHK